MLRTLVALPFAPTRVSTVSPPSGETLMIASSRTPPPDTKVRVPVGCEPQREGR